MKKKKLPVNIKEFKELILRYEGITLEEIKKAKVNRKVSLYYGGKKANVLTGYSDKQTCSLCRSIEGKCQECAWYRLTLYSCSGNYNTYVGIYYARTAKQLITAFKSRAEYMRKVLIDNKIDINKI